MMTKYTAFGLVITAALLATAVPTTGEPVPPGDGELLIDNQLVAGADSCSGSIRLSYGIMATQEVRRWTAEIDESCGLIVKQSQPEATTVFAPVGSVIVKPGLNLWTCRINYGCATDSVNMSVEFNFGAGYPAPCHPEFVGGATTYRTRSIGWSSGTLDSWYLNPCGSQAVQDHVNGNDKGRTGAFAQHHTADCRLTDIEVFYGGDRGSTMCFMGNVDPSEWTWPIEDEIARVVSGKYLVVTVT